MPAPPLMVSPFVMRFNDYMDRAITITINFDPETRQLLGGNVVRDPGCLWTKIVWDTPTSANAKRFPSVPEGTTNFTSNQIRNATGFTTIDQVTALQITAEA